MSRNPMRAASMLAAMIALGTESLAGQDPDLPPDEGSAFTAAAVGAGSPTAGRMEYAVRRVTADIEVDGHLDEPGWATAAPISLDWETAPGDNEPAPVRTECHLAYDASALYLGCRALDPDPGSIRAYITDRDGTRGHDRIILSLDPFNDARRAFEFGVSAVGVQNEGVYDEMQRSADGSWDAIWESAGRIDERGYVIEAAIPFRSLRFPSGRAPQTWGFHLRREWPRTTSVETRSMIWDRSEACVLCQANHATGIRPPDPRLDVEIVPTLTATKTDRRETFPAGSLTGGSPEPEAGLDARWAVTTDVSLNLTVNPDFSQVEADAPQLDVNRRFALFFPEKRPFFLEAADLFRTPLRAVFSRSVADPVFGSKLTGKLGDHAVAAMFTLDEVNNLIFPGSQGSSSTSLDRRAGTTFVRLRRDFGASNTIGVLYTGRVSEGYHNHVAGADLFFRPLPAFRVSLQALRSWTAYPEEVARGFGQPETGFAGHAGRVDLAYRTRNWYASARAWAFDPEFRADAGFMPRVDARGVGVSGARNFWGAGPLTRIGINAGFSRTEDWGGRLTDQNVWMMLDVYGPWQSNVWINPSVSRERFGDEVFTLTGVWGGLSLRPSGAIGLGLWGSAGEAIDFANGRKGRQLSLNSKASVRIGHHLDLRGSLRYQRMTHRDSWVFSTRVAELRGVYSFSTRAFFRALVQLRDTDRDPARYDAPVRPSENGWLTQLLFSYKVNPLTVFFLGYGDDRQGFTDADLTRVPLTQRERAFFVKLGYAWRP